MTTYKIIRHYRFRSERPTIASGLTLEEAREHCQNPETSSDKAISEAALAETEKHGPWFDGYEEE